MKFYTTVLKLNRETHMKVFHLLTVFFHGVFKGCKTGTLTRNVTES